jgi:hypothetical protein
MTLSPITGKFNIYSSPATGTADNTLPMNIRMTLTKEGNMGVQGNNDPHSPVSFADQLGNKISLWGNSPVSHYGFGVQASLLQMYSGTAADDIALGYGSSAAFTENMRIKGNGMVGIGTSTPLGKLHVRDDQQYVLVMDNSTPLDDDVRTDMIFKTGTKYTGGIATIGTGSVSARMGLFTYATGSAGLLKERMSILDNGNIGINTINPAAKLDVIGKTKITQAAGDNAALEITGGIIVSGANKVAFVRTIGAGESGTNNVIIDHIMCNGDPNAILMVTAQSNTPFWVSYDAGVSKWRLHTGGEYISGATMFNLKTCSDNCTTPKIPNTNLNTFGSGEKFNILVIKAI